MENLPTYRLTQSGPEAQEILDQVNLNTVDIEQLKRLYQALNQSEPEIIEPTDTWPVANPEENVIYRVIDRVNTPPQYYTDYMWNGTSMVPMAQYNNAIDNEPTANSNNLVKSGGVYSFVHANGGAYDISAAHAVGGVLATYDDLADALGTNGSNVPAAVRKGGMSVKYVNSSDNKYVQWRYMGTSTADADFTNVANWQGVVNDSLISYGNELMTKNGFYLENAYAVGYSSANYRINTNGDFGGNSSNKHIYLPVLQGEKYHVDGIESYVLRVAFATTNESASYGVIPVVSGTSVVEIPANTDIWMTIPEGCTYLLLWRNDVSTGFTVKKTVDIDNEPKASSKNIVESGGVYRQNPFTKEEPSQTTDNKYIVYSNGSEAESESHSIIYYFNVLPNIQYHIKLHEIGSSAASIAIFKDGNYVKSESFKSSGLAERSFLLTFDVACVVAISTQYEYADSLIFLKDEYVDNSKYTPISPMLLEATSSTDKLNEAVGKIDKIVNTGFILNPSCETADGYYKSSDGSFVAGSGRKSYIYQVAEGDTFLLQFRSLASAGIAVAFYSGYPAKATFISDRMIAGNSSDMNLLITVGKNEPYMVVSTNSVYRYYVMKAKGMSSLIFPLTQSEIKGIDYVPTNPLAKLNCNPGYTAIFRKFGVIGGSMASGEHVYNNGNNRVDLYDFSFIQCIGRMCGSQAFNFSKGGMSARAWSSNSSYGGNSQSFLNDKCDCYIIQLGNNDAGIHADDPTYELGTIADVVPVNGVYADTFYGNYAKILSKIREVQPRAYVFCATFYSGYGAGGPDSDFDYRQAIRDIVAYFNATPPENDELHYFLVDLATYGKPWSYYSNGIHAGTVRGSHLVSTGYLYNAYEFMTYIDWIIQNNMSKFNDVAFVGTNYHW